jgi:hypothetical protein
MKQQTKTKLLLIGLIIILLASCVPAVAQDSVNLELTILLDNKKVNQKYELILTDSKNNQTIYKTVDSKVLLELEFNNEYVITVSSPYHNSKTIYFNTKAPKENWYIITTIGLDSDDNCNIIAGGIKYNKKLKTFQKYLL